MQPPDSDNLPQVQTESKGEYCFVASLTNGGFGYRYGAYVEGHRSWWLYRSPPVDPDLTIGVFADWMHGFSN